jgi:hypothetical protein
MGSFTIDIAIGPYWQDNAGMGLIFVQKKFHENGGKYSIKYTENA